MTGSRQQVQIIVSSLLNVGSRQQPASHGSWQTLAGSRQQDFDDGEAKKTSRLCG